MTVRLLLTGFVPFPPNSPDRNPSGDAARHLDGHAVHAFPGGGESYVARIVSHVLPVVFGEAAAIVRKLVEERHPAIVVSLGMAAATYRVERFATDADYTGPDDADNRGVRFTETRRQHPTEPMLLPTALPVRAIERAIADAGGRVQASSSAGSFVCNDVFYELMRFFRQEGARYGLLRAGFIHLPTSREQPNQAAIDRAVEAALVAALADLTATEYAAASR